MVQYLRIAARSLAAHRTRTLLIGGAVTAVTVILVLLLSLTAGIRRTILRNATALASGHVNIAGFYKLSQTSANPMVTKFPPLLEIAQKNVPEAAHIYHRLKSFGKIISDTGSITAPIWGIDMKNERQIIGHLLMAKKSAYIEKYQNTPGEPESEGNLLDLEKPGSIALFATHAKKLKVKVGDSVTVSLPTYRNIYNTKDVRVVAVLADMGMMSAFTTFMNEADTREIYQMPADATGQIMIVLKDPAQVPAVEDRLRKVIADAGYKLMDKESQPYWMKFDRVAGESWTGQRIDVTTWQDETAYVKWVLSLLGALTFVFTGILLVIVILGLVNTLWMAVRERTPEIGTLRAIGLQRGQVLLMFLLEALMLSTGSILSGIGLGTLLAVLVNAAKIPITSEAFQMFLMSNVVELSVEAPDLALTFGLLGFFMVAASLWPSYRASRMRPVIAVNYVN
jgi:putative ABC transport system permease protein